MHLVPNSFGAPRRLREGNDCHEPGGSSKGGEFARKGTCSPAMATQREADYAKYKALKAEWTRINNQMLDYVNNPHAPECEKLLGQLKDLCKAMYRLDADPGGVEGIGRPGGPRDLVIIGAGPGGMTAAIAAAYEGLDTLFIDAQPTAGGQARFSSRIENYPGFPAGVTGRQLMNDMYEQAVRIGAEPKLSTRVTGLTHDPETGLKTLTLSDGTSVEARSVIIAGGNEFHKFPFPGSTAPEVTFGNGEKLEADSMGKPAVVIGGANSAAQAALGAARHASHVTIIARSPLEKGMSAIQIDAVRNHPRITVIEGDELRALSTDANGHAEEVVTAHGRRIPAAALGVFVGSSSKTDWLPPTIERGAEKKIKVGGKDRHPLETGLPGVFAIGDMRANATPRVGVAVGDGQFAVRGVFEYFERVKAHHAAS